MAEDTFWRNFINGLDIKYDLIGDPEFISEENEEEGSSKTVADGPPNIGDSEAAVLRIKLDVYIISPIGSNQAFMVTGKSSMEDGGIMTVRNAIKLIERRKKR